MLVSQTSLAWTAPPECIFICTRRGNDDVLRAKMIDLGNWLIQTYGSTILIEPVVYEEVQQFQTWTAADTNSLHNNIDLIISMGGDGTLMHVSSMFPKAHPPVLAFNFGSMGFLTPFDFTNYQTEIPLIFSQSHLTLR